MAERTGFEPATPGVTGRYSNQLNYRSVGIRKCSSAAPPTRARMLPANRALSNTPEHFSLPSFALVLGLEIP